MLSREELLEGLTDPQRQAAAHTDGPLLIIAGAGSGKTRVLTRRVAHLMAIGIPASSILAITFTNKAAGEMKERVGKLLDRPLRDIGRLDQYNPMICTFHSLCMRILRHYGDRIGVPSNFTVYDSSDQNKLIKDALKTLEISSQNFSPGQVHASISNLKNQLVTAEQYAQSASAFYEKNVARIYGKYQAMLKANNALDFDDLLMRAVHGMRDHKDVLSDLQERFQYILIDEYQDTNKAQYVLAHALAMKHKNICVVGDPDQSIYAWRGADIQNILDFEKDYADATVVRLEQNYRSTKTILALASALISKNRRRKEKGLWTENAEGDKARYYVCQTEDDEANTIIDALKEQHEKHDRPWSDMAVFYRMNSLSRVIEERLMRQRIPYQVARGVEFYNRKEIKDVLCYLRVLCNPADEVSLARIINTPTRGIGDESVRKMQTFGVGQGLPLWEAMQNPALVTGLSTRAIKSTQAFVAMMNALREQVARPANVFAGDTQSVGEAESGAALPDMFTPPRAGAVQSIMQNVIDQSGLRAALEKSSDPDKPELANVRELINSGADFDREHPEGTLTEYLAQVSLMSDIDKVRDGGGGDHAYDAACRKGPGISGRRHAGHGRRRPPPRAGPNRPGPARRRTPALFCRHHAGAGARHLQPGVRAHVDGPARAHRAFAVSKGNARRINRHHRSHRSGFRERRRRCGQRQRIPPRATCQTSGVRAGEDRRDSRHGPAHAGDCRVQPRRAKDAHPRIRSTRSRRVAAAPAQSKARW